jgi:hypothetical protein
MSYLDYLPDDVLDSIYGKVITDTTNDIETQLVALETSLIIITKQIKYTPYMLKMLTFEAHVIVNYPEHPIYDKFLHINPNINLRRRIKAKVVRVIILNEWDIHIHTYETGLAGNRPQHITLDITEETHGPEPVTNFSIIDDMMRYVLANPITVHDDAWDYNCVASISIYNDDNDDNDDYDYDYDVAYNNLDYIAKDNEEVVEVYITLSKNLWTSDDEVVIFGRTHEYSEITEFDDEE